MSSKQPTFVRIVYLAQLTAVSIANDTLIGLKVVNNRVSCSFRLCGRGKGYVRMRRAF